MPEIRLRLREIRLTLLLNPNTISKKEKKGYSLK